MKHMVSLGPLMRCCWLLISLASAKEPAQSTVNFGPQGCVSLSRSEAGSCVIATDCKGEDTSKVEFAFICVDKDGAEVKHTFGVGGFLEQEEYDTEVGCAQCILEDGVTTTTKKKTEVVEPVEPATDKVAEKAAPAAEAEAEPATPAAPAKEMTSKKVETAAKAKGAPATTDDSRTLLTKFANSKKKAGSGVPPATAKFYGPGGCVATYKSSGGTCMMQTRCEGQNITEYDFGLDCLDSEGETTRHLFGKNSFDKEETFDTLVPCETCLGVDQQAPKEVGQLATNVLTLQHEMSAIKDDLKVIKEHLEKDHEEKAKEKEEKEEKEKDVQKAPEDEVSEAEAPKDEAEGGDADGGDAEASDEGTSLSDVSDAEAEDTADAEDAAASLAATESAEDEAPAEDEAEPKRTFLRKARKHRAHTDTVQHTRKRAHHRREPPAVDLDLEAPEVDDY